MTIKVDDEPENGVFVAEPAKERAKKLPLVLKVRRKVGRQDQRDQGS